jgi:hypothetical protein
MSDFFKKVKSVFIIEDEPAAPKPQNDAEPARQPVSEAPQPVQAPTRQPVAAISGEVSDKFIQILSAALEKNNQPGFDYLEFRQALVNLAKMPMDESTRFQSAYAMAQTMGVTKQKLLESAQFYLQILGAEQAKFNEAHAQQRQKLIGGREDEIKAHESAILQKTEQIQKLTQEIEQHRQQSEKVRADIQESTVKIETTRADFEASFTAVAGQLQQDAQKIQQYLS